MAVATRSADEQQRALSMGAEWAGGYDDPPPFPLDAAVTFAPAGDVVVAALRALENWAATQNARWLGLQVVATNAPAIALYERLGYVSHATNRFWVKS